MADKSGPKAWAALDLPVMEPIAKRVVFDDSFYRPRNLSVRQIGDLDRIRSLIAVGGDLAPYYRRSTAFDALLQRQQILHLHLGGPGSDAILYLIQYPGHVLFLCVDGHVHLDDIPPGKGIRVLGRKRFEQRVEAADTLRSQRLGASVRTLLGPRKPK